MLRPVFQTRSGYCLSPSMIAAIISYLLALPLARGQSGNTDNVEMLACENGTFGELGLIDAGAILISGNAGFLLITDCASKTSVAITPVGECSVKVGRDVSVAAAPIGTPSPTTPVFSYLDVGPGIVISGPQSELKLNRSVSGPVTTYDGRIDKPALPFLVAGHYEVSVPGGRDIAAFRAGFDFTPLALTSPASQTNLSSQKPLTVTWSGGEFMPGDLFANIILANSTDTFTASCRLADGNSGSYTFPDAVWTRIPSSLFSLSSVTVQVAGSTLKTLSVPELEKGLRVRIPQASSVFYFTLF